MMAQMCLLVAVFILTSVIGRDIDNIEEYKADFVEDIFHNVRRQAAPDAGRRVTECSTDETSVVASPTDGDVFSYFTLIYVSNRTQICAGGILAEFLVITTASCVGVFTRMPFAVVGYHDANVSGNVYTGEHFAIPRRHSPNVTTGFDLAIMTLAPDDNGHGIQFSDKVKSLCVTTNQCLLESNPTFIMVGISRINGTRRTLAQYLLTPVLNQYCSALGYSMTGNMLCARRTGPSNCDGFIGSPAFFRYGSTFLMWGLVAKCLNESLVIISSASSNLTCH